VVGKEPDAGETSRVVAENVERLRKAQNMNFTQLSEKLADAASWSINAVGIRRIEKGERRVTPDDLTALAVALGVSPITLLMPATESASDPVAVTGFPEQLPADRLWNWLTADDTLPQIREQVRVLGPQFRDSFRAAAWPIWTRERLRELNLAEIADLLRGRGGDVGDDQ
jgi:transcriptional regulator with XRE-family HTH domain